MKRDPELIRQILIRIEETSDGMRCGNMEFEGFEENTVTYHCRLLSDAGFIKAINSDSNKGIFCKPQRLTMEGHDLLDTIRNDSLWNKFKELSKEHGLKVVFQVLTNDAAKMLGLLN